MAKLTILLTNSHEPIANGIAAATAPNQISQPGLCASGTYWLTAVLALAIKGAAA